MAESAKRNFPKPIYHAAGKNSFLEVYDNMDIGKMSVTITLYDPERENSKVTQKASFYIDYPAFLGLSAVAGAGGMEHFISEDAPKKFPKYAFTEKTVQRTWSVKKSETGNYQISITEKEMGAKWEDAKTLGKASFYLSPFEFVAFCKTAEAHIISYLASQKQSTGVREEYIEAPVPARDLTME
jgi:hypothetical protein